MKRLMITLVMLFALSATSMFANTYLTITSNDRHVNENATVVLRNSSDYTLTLKICHLYGGTYRVVELYPRTNRTIAFGKTATYKLKIKATKNGQSSYHDGGNFSVTCNQYEWSEGEMSFKMSTYGTGLGPSISKAEFENDN